MLKNRFPKKHTNDAKMLHGLKQCTHKYDVTMRPIESLLHTHDTVNPQYRHGEHRGESIDEHAEKLAAGTSSPFSMKQESNAVMASLDNRYKTNTGGVARKWAGQEEIVSKLDAKLAFLSSRL